MSGTINTIPSSEIVGVNPFVLAAGGAAFDLIGLVLDDESRVPIGNAYIFPDLAGVQAYFGATSKQAQYAAVYFGGFTGANRLPGSLLITQYPVVAVSGWLRGASLAGMTLTQLKALSGTLSVTIDGSTITSSPITLGSATSFSSAAGIISTALGTTGLQQASAVASAGATFTGSGSGTNLTVTAVQGVIHDNVSLSGSGVPVGTTILRQTSGTTGGAGVYVTSVATTATAASLTANSSILDVTQIISGSIAPGQQVSGPGVPAGTFVAAYGTGTGDLGTYTLSNVFHVASQTVTMLTPTVTFDSIAFAFVISSGTAGDNSSVSFASGTLADSLGLTQATGAIISPGSDATDPITFMSEFLLISQSWCCFEPNFDPDHGVGNTQKMAFAAWANSQNNQHLYVCIDHDPTPTQSPAATGSMGFQLLQSGSSGTAMIYTPPGEDKHPGAFLAGTIAAIDFDETNGRTTAAFRTQSGLPTGVTNGIQSRNLLANGYNYYGAYSSIGNQPFNWFYPGKVSGQFTWIDSYVNQIWITNELRSALMTMLGQYKSIPYNVAGYAIVRASILDPANAAVNFGAIRPGVPLSAEQAAFVNNSAGVAVDGVLSTLGWFLQILAASPQTRAARGSPPMTFWYMDGESIQKINLASILIQ